jgi:hypothetical protein
VILGASEMTSKFPKDLLKEKLTTDELGIKPAKRETEFF